jgi:hypothetical protein
MLSLEVFKIVLIRFILGRFLVLGQLRIVLLLGGIGLTLTGLPGIRWQNLPSLPNNLGYFRERKVLALEDLSHLCRASATQKSSQA